MSTATEIDAMVKKAREVMGTIEPGAKLSPEREALFVSLLKYEHMALCVAVLVAVEQNNMDELFEVAKHMATIGLNPVFKERVQAIEAARKAAAEKVADLNKQPVKKSTGPSPWSL